MCRVSFSLYSLTPFVSLSPFSSPINVWHESLFLSEFRETKNPVYARTCPLCVFVQMRARTGPLRGEKLERCCVRARNLNLFSPMANRIVFFFFFSTSRRSLSP